MDLGISGRTALVLGASGGLGGAVAESLVAEGVTVFAAGRNLDKLNARRDWLGAASERFVPFALDLSDLAALEGRVAELLAQTSIDILVNNSGGPPPGPTQNQSADAWLTQFSAMAASLFRLTDLLLPGMIERGWGRIITIGSSGMEQPIPNLALSNGVRGAVVGWSKTLAAEVAAHGITANIVLPGRIATERVAQLDNAAAARQQVEVESVRRQSLQAIPVGRYGAPEEFGAMCAFLASTQAAYVTGSMIRVDGGMIRSI